MNSILELFEISLIFYGFRACRVIIKRVRRGGESSDFFEYVVSERKLGFFVKIKPPARRAYAPEGKEKILTTPEK